MKSLLSRLSVWLARDCATRRAEAMRNERPDVGVGAEAPIRKASEDRLRRGDFAGRIADVLSELSLSEGRVFAIRGGWGFGKSSLKNLVSERLDAKGDGADWVDFNPWQWGDGDAIARALFGQIADRLGGEHSKAALARAEAFRHYGAILTGVAAPLSREAAGSSHLVSTVLTNVSVIAVTAAIGLQLPAMFGIAQRLAGPRDADPFNSPSISAWRATSWFLKRIPEAVRGQLAIEALRKTRALSVAAILIDLNDPAQQREGGAARVVEADASAVLESPRSSSPARRASVRPISERGSPSAVSLDLGREGWLLRTEHSVARGTPVFDNIGAAKQCRDEVTAAVCDFSPDYAAHEGLSSRAYADAAFATLIGKNISSR